MNSEVYYQQSVPPRPALDSDVDCEVCVIGGGFAGLNAALGLIERGQSGVVLIEGEHVGYGASGRNGGFVFGGYSLGEEAMLRQLGAEHAQRLYQLTLDGVELIRSRIDAWGVACDKTEAGILLADWFADAEKLRDRQAFLAEHYDVHWEWLSADAVRDRLDTTRYQAGLLEPRGFHFHPYRYALALADRIEALGGRIFERSPATDLRPYPSGVVVQTPTARITARRVVIACGGYLGRLYRPVSQAVMPIRTFVMTTAPLPDVHAQLIRTPSAIYDTRFAFDYYRMLTDQRLLWGGRISALDADRDAMERRLRADLERVFPQLSGVAVDFCWSGIMGYSRHKMPHIGCMDERIWYAEAFGGHGVSTSNIGGDVLARAMLGEDDDWRLFQPFGLDRTFGPLGRAAAQLTYWSLQTADWLRERRPARR